MFSVHRLGKEKVQHSKSKSPPPPLCLKSLCLSFVEHAVWKASHEVIPPWSMSIPGISSCGSLVQAVPAIPPQPDVQQGALLQLAISHHPFAGKSSRQKKPIHRKTMTSIDLWNSGYKLILTIHLRENNERKTNINMYHHHQFCQNIERARRGKVKAQNDHMTSIHKISQLNCISLDFDPPILPNWDSDHIHLASVPDGFGWTHCNHVMTRWSEIIPSYPI